MLQSENAKAHIGPAGNQTILVIDVLSCFFEKRLVGLLHPGPDFGHGVFALAFDEADQQVAVLGHVECLFDRVQFFGYFNGCHAA